ncbi:lipoyl domain-containing protein [Haloferax larsenii]|uniref:Lipoyl domain-containing protein n=1 Tax=Haloferax larsenii TaxID=302484 RepID=A0ABY5RDS1_HALLR|nr:lipoyl domain-containing protein [Haloferax larsenii]ELZ78397.1 dihydrolipoamide succinyltransferase [Haloferax larsenii JCM 13917]UVE50319.1 lipoyl domain-containing protein [Haloferax larsenii]
MAETVDVDSATVWPEDADDVTEAYLANWFVREGSAVDQGETLCEMQVEKVSIDVTAPVSGTVTEIVVGEGVDFDRGDVLARIRPSA